MRASVAVVAAAWVLAFAQGTQVAGASGPAARGVPRELSVQGAEAELERGEVTAVEGELLRVSAAGSPLTVRMLASTRVEGELPAPGAEIRVRGRIDAGTGATLIVASEVEVLRAPGS